MPFFVFNFYFNFTNYVSSLIRGFVKVWFVVTVLPQHFPRLSDYITETFLLTDSTCMLLWLVSSYVTSINIFFFFNVKIDPKPCNPRSLQKPKRSNSYPKVFLGGLPSNITETDLRTYFTRFGKVMEVVIMYDQEKKKSRGEWGRIYYLPKQWFAYHSLIKHLLYVVRIVTG